MISARKTRAYHYSARLFSTSIAEGFCRHIARFVDSVATLRNADLRTIELMDHREHEATLAAGRGTSEKVHGDTVVGLITEIAAQRPDTAAIEFGDLRISYQSLSTHAQRLAVWLKPHLPEKHAPVGMCVPPGPEQIVVLVAILKVGGIVVPVDLTMPPTRLSLAIEDAGVRVAVVHGARPAQLPQHVNILELPLTEDVPIADVLSNEPLVPASDQPAYIMFTSGSTGRPKVVAMTDAALANLVEWQVARSARELRTAGRRSLAFDVGFQEVFSTLCCGGTLVMMDDDQRRDISGLADFIRLWRIDRVFLRPVALHQLAERMHDSDVNLGSLREVVVAGDVLHITAPHCHTAPSQRADHPSTIIPSNDSAPSTSAQGF